jgi:hypothetical protein
MGLTAADELSLAFGEVRDVFWDFTRSIKLTILSGIGGKGNREVTCQRRAD